MMMLPNRTNSDKLRLSLRIYDINVFLNNRLKKLKIKYENTFNEKLTIYDKLNINNDIMDDLKLLGNKFNYNINDNYLKRLNDRIYKWYVYLFHLILRFMCVRGSFREDIY